MAEEKHKEKNLKEIIEEEIKGRPMARAAKGAGKFFKFSLYSAWTVFYTSTFVFAFFVFAVYLSYAKSFEIARIKDNSTQNTFFDKNGEIIYQSYGAREPEVIPLNDIPHVVKNATLASEDADFYYHTAIDVRGLVRAAVNNIKSSEKPGLYKFTDLFSEENYSSGGSTITQQLVKNIYLTNERSFDRKIKEIIYSFELEKKWSKDKIFEEYLNNVYYGEQSLGIENAAKNYFDKSAKELDLAEASMLAGITVAPTRLSPINGSFEEAKKRQEYVLSNMVHKGMINIEQAKEAANQPLYFKDQTYNTTLKYPYFVQYVKEELAGKIGQDALDMGGLKVYTTLDSAKQAEAERIASGYVKKFSYQNVSNASAVVLDNQEGTISAMVGGVDWNKSKVNVATSRRQPGSSFKPLVYTAGLLNNYTASSLFYDGSVNFGGIPPYRPKNYDGKYHGIMTMRYALGNSLNIPAVEMAKLAGVDEVIKTAETMGVDIEGEAKNYGLSIGLGSAEVRLFELARAYSIYPNGGQMANFTSVDRIVDNEGVEIYKQPKYKEDALDEKVAYIMTNILSDNDARKMTFGSASPLTLKDRPVGAKTGTTDNYSDSWTMGFTPQYTVGVWMGNNDHSKMRKVSGVEGAAYIWHDIMVSIHKGLPAKSFTKPDGLAEAWINPKNGLPAKSQRKPNILEYFLPGTVPTEKEKYDYLAQFKKGGYTNYDERKTNSTNRRR